MCRMATARLSRSVPAWIQNSRCNYRWRSHPEYADVGSFTFSNVKVNHTIYVRTVTQNVVTLSVEISKGGYVEFSVDGGEFIGYADEVSINGGSDLDLRAVSAEEYNFDCGEGSRTSAESEISLMIFHHP